MADYDGSMAVAAANGFTRITCTHTHTHSFIDGDGILFSFIYNDDTLNFSRYFMSEFGSLSISSLHGLSLCVLCVDFLAKQNKTSGGAIRDERGHSLSFQSVTLVVLLICAILNQILYIIPTKKRRTNPFVISS